LRILISTRSDPLDIVNKVNKVNEVNFLIITAQHSFTLQSPCIQRVALSLELEGEAVPSRPTDLGMFH
jgi:hypothetical protein